MDPSFPQQHFRFCLSKFFVQDIPQPSRPPHRLSISNSGSFSGRSHTRNNSSITGSLNPNHRVTRRKSVSQNNTNVAALAAAARDVSGDTSFSMPAQRRGTLSRSFGKSSLHTPPSSLPFSRPTIATKHSLGKHDNAIEDDEIENYEEDEIVGPFDKARQRRASEGQSAKGIGKKAKDDLRCTKCGKGYKHSSCLTKHLFVPTFPSCVLVLLVWHAVCCQLRSPSSSLRGFVRLG